ncbi:19751_t:CDS:1, partial [Funneliformis geosporum]
PKINELEEQINNLIKKNTLLEDEASSYQSALGAATNFQLSDNDQNHAVKLNNDIADLNDNIKNYVTNLKQNIVVNIKEVKKLLSLYKCPVEIKDQRTSRLLIQAVLQRHVIEIIFESATQYFQYSGRPQLEHLESQIVSKECELSELLNYASKYRSGNDEITHVAPIKLRQQIYSILSNRGFEDTCRENNTAYEHPFITNCKRKLNDIMNGLRIINDRQMKSDSEKLAVTIIREVVNIFYFRLKVQEPVVQHSWFSYNARLDKTLMDGNQYDSDYENLYVDLCYFPLIGKDLMSENRKVYTLAKV